MNPREAIRKEYESGAADYDEEWSYYIRSTTDETVRRLQLAAGDRILDVGCGTGVLLSSLRSQGLTDLVGVDLSVNMLRQAHRKLEGTPLLAGDAEALPFQSNRFDAVISVNSFHFFPSPHRFLEEAVRVMTSGGILVVTDWCDDYWACRICDYYLRFVNDAHIRMFGSRNLRRLLEEAGFVEISLDTFKIDWLWGLMTARAKLP